MRIYLLPLFLIAGCTDACIRVAPPAPGMPAAPCKTCAANLIIITQLGAGAKKMDGDSIVTTGACSQRTFTCKGIQATIEFSGAGGALGAVQDGGTGTATYTVTCSADGTKWEADGQTITGVECAAVPPCRDCDPTLITVIEDGPQSSPMEDSTVYDSGCAVRTFTCKGDDPSIAVSTDGGPLAPIDDGGTGTATFVVTCNQGGTGWMSGGDVITSVECMATPLCKKCAMDLITVTDNVGLDAKDMDDDTTVMTGKCSERTFTCMGTDAKISIMTAGGPIAPVTDGGTGTALYTVTCNMDGTGWTAGGQTITTVECSATPACKICAKNLITVTNNVGLDAKDMDDDQTVMTGKCSERTFTCKGKDAKISIMTAGGPIAPVTDGGTGTALYTVTCNMDGTGWTAGGQTITTVECSATPECKMCAKNLITVTNNVGLDAKDMDDDQTVMTGKCSERTFTCKGKDAKISIMTAGGPIAPVTDGGTGTALYTVTCNMDGTGWTAGGQTITTVECSATPECKMCAKNLITVTNNVGLDAKDMDDDQTVMTGKCSERTFTCKGKDAKISIMTAGGPIAPVTDGGTGTALYTVTCNMDGTGWTAGGQTITTVECSATPECKMCAKNLITVTNNVGLDAKDMDDDQTVMTGKCSERTFTCKGKDAKISIMSAGGPIAPVTDGGTGTVLYTVTCNMDGTGWTAGGQTITTVECSATPACKICAKNLITVTNNVGLDAKDMDDDQTVMTGKCSERTFTCKGKDAKISIMTAGGPIAPVTDGGTGTALYTVTCNMDGTGWTTGGQTITTVECSATPECKMCAKNLITVTNNVGLDAKDMDDDQTVMTGKCSERTFTCKGKDAKISIMTAGGPIAPVTDGGTGTALYTVTCNMDGTGWTAGGQTITTVECSATPECKMCAKNLITVTNNVGLDAKDMDDDQTVMTGKCSERTFTCKGKDAKISIMTAGGPIAPVTDGGTDTALYTVTCNMDGTGWTAGGQVITSVQCSATPACKMCAKTLIDITQAGEGGKPMDSDNIVTTGVCAERTFTCKGKSASIDFFENGALIGTFNDDDNDDVTTFTVTCNMDGTGWFIGAQKVTGVECSAEFNALMINRRSACRLCDPTLIMITQNGPDAKMMDMDNTAFDSGCAVRTFTCKGVMASIAVSTAGGPIAPVGDGGTGTATYAVTCNAAGTMWTAGGQTITQVECSATPRPIAPIGDGGTGTATYVVTCNAAGTGWTAGGQTITSVECTATPLCTTCTQNQLMIVQLGAGAQPMTNDAMGMKAGCLTRTLTCTGNLASIEFTFPGGGTGAIYDPPSNVVTELVCAADGSGWQYLGIAVVSAECAYSLNPG
uniref:Uncharacterized protein n=1 Tax=Pristionchus pacificus TaxID=54126 RepID=A0A2A6BRU2_PRIPA|eukprot:PDM68620.1 hypothetical protein PRIPAC_46922 [Pristionchus pacificus]